MRLEPLGGTAVPSIDAPPVADLEAVKVELVAAFEAERDALWKAGEVVFDYLRAGAESVPAKHATKHRRAVARDLAACGDCTANRIIQLAEVWAAFGAEGLRAEDRGWTFHRAVLLAAKRTQRPVADVLEEALAKGWSVADLSTLGRSEAGARRLVAVCESSGAKVRVEAPRGVRAYDVTTGLRCPVCVDAHVLGTLQ